MPKTISPHAHAYDDFSGPQLDAGKWMYLEYRMPDGSSWRCAEPGAVTSVADGALSVSVDRFRLEHDGIQIMDNPKHLLLSTKSFSLPRSGLITFSADMAVSCRGNDLHDYRDGVAAFNVLDMESGWVFDVAANNDHMWAIHEMLPVPSAAAAPFTHVVEDPFAGLTMRPGRPHRCQVVIDTGAGSVTWLVDDKPIHHVASAHLPRQVRVGLGMFTLRPIVFGKSQSLRGQGMSAWWSNLTVEEQAF